MDARESMIWKSVEIYLEQMEIGLGPLIATFGP